MSDSLRNDHRRRKFYKQLLNNRYKSTGKVLLILVLFIFPFIKSQGQTYSVATDPWQEELGNHCAVLEIANKSDAVSVDLLWRRHDLKPEDKRFLIIEASTGDSIQNVFRTEVNNERSQIVIGPVLNPGTYYFYYLPSTFVPGRSWGARAYAPIEDAPDSKWVEKHNLNKVPSKYKYVTKATVKEIQSRTEFDSFYLMEVVATDKELKSYLKQYNNDYLVFAEDSKLPIRMLDAIPLSWTEKAPGRRLCGESSEKRILCFTIRYICFSKAYLQH